MSCVLENDFRTLLENDEESKNRIKQRREKREKLGKVTIWKKGNGSKTGREKERR